MKKFDSPTALAYDQDIRARIPGYDLIQDLLCSVLQVEVSEENASVLVAGSGSAEEICRLGQQHPQWTFTGIDPSAAMNALALKKLQARELISRVQLEEKSVEQFSSAQRFAVGLSVLVSHFIPDDGSKEIYFQIIAKHLKPGAPLLIVDLIELS